MWLCSCKGAVMWLCSCEAYSNVACAATRCAMMGHMQGMLQYGTCREWGGDMAI
jgi:hypothetical protein